MPQFFKNLRAGVSGISPRDLIYPGIVFLFMIMVGVLFFLATQFITKNVNNAFSGDTGGESSALNMANYTLVTKKLGISTSTVEQNVVAVPTVGTSTPATGATQEPDKKAISITILNSTAKKGVATALAQSLESAGFAKATTGNMNKLYAVTTIVIKESKGGYAPFLLKTVRKTYPEAVATTTTAGAFDATIIIGTR